MFVCFISCFDRRVSSEANLLAILVFTIDEKSSGKLFFVFSFRLLVCFVCAGSLVSFASDEDDDDKDDESLSMLDDDELELEDDELSSVVFFLPFLFEI
jgi:hypothetical protein